MPPATLAGATPQGSILVVDDQPANLRAVSALLTRHGYDVRTAHDGRAALARANGIKAPRYNIRPGQALKLEGCRTS